MFQYNLFLRRYLQAMYCINPIFNKVRRKSKKDRSIYAKEKMLYRELWKFFCNQILPLKFNLWEIDALQRNVFTG